MKKARSKFKEDALFFAILSLKNLVEAKQFFCDLLTKNELKEFSQRWRAAQMLSHGVSYVQISQETGMSSTTIARIQKWLTEGEGGYRLVLDRLHHHAKNSRGRGLR